jgi:hypothetical protein
VIERRKFEMMTRTSRVVTTALLAAAAVAAVSGDALARRGVHRAHFSKRRLPADFVRDDPSQTTVNLPPMRYYGGPKSPMWRG